MNRDNGGQDEDLILQGVHMLASQLCQAITVSYVDNMKYPFNHLIIYKGDFV